MNYAIILSGGTGRRLGLDIPKQYYEVNNKPIIGYVIDTFNNCKEINGVVVVAAPEWHEYLSEHLASSEKFLGFAEPGKNRQLSIYNGLCFLKKCLPVKDEDLVLIQDAARPNTSLGCILSCLSIADDEDGAMPVLPMKDTIYMSEDGQMVSGLLERKTLFAGQAPESFRFGKYLTANEALLPEKILSINGSTEPAILAGMNICMISGDEDNYKITTSADLRRFEKQCNNIS